MQTRALIEPAGSAGAAGSGVGTVHTVAENLWVIEGHHPRRVWEDPDIPSIVVYHHQGTLFLLDSGVGPAMRNAVLALAAERGRLDEVVLLNSHGHLDHLGNNAVIDAIAARSRRHFIPAAARPALDSRAFFGAMYRRGLSYFDYLDGLSVQPDAIRSMMIGLGASPDVTAAAVAAAGQAVLDAGLGPAINALIPSMVVELLLRTYPAVDPRVAGMLDYEQLGPARTMEIDGTTRSGWSFGDGAVRVLTSGGHSAGGCVFYIQEHGFLMLADETSTVPIWADSNPARTAATARWALELVDRGSVRNVCAGHFPMLPVAGPDVRAVFERIIAAEHEFRTVVDRAVSARGEVGIDQLYADLVGSAEPGSIVATTHRLQFPVFPTFLKLTLLHQCQLMGYPEVVDAAGTVRFTGARPRPESRS